MYLCKALNYCFEIMTTDSGWDDDVISTDSGNTFTDITPMGGHQHGYCDVFKARRQGKWLVLKSLKPQYRNTPACQAMLRKEFEIGYQLSHHGIAATLGLEQVDAMGECIIEEWVDGIRLDHFIADKSFSVDQARDIIAQLCEVLKYIHTHQVIHRDLKPSNILITADGGRVKVIDFGVSDTASHAIFKGPAGTRDYTAPELMASETGDSRADIYSLGVIINLMNNHLPKSNRQLAAIARWCCAADREQRPATASKVLEALNRKPVVKFFLIAASILATIMIVTTIAMIIRYSFPKQHDTPTQPAITDTTSIVTPTETPIQSIQSVQSVESPESAQHSQSSHPPRHNQPVQSAQPSQSANQPSQAVQPVQQEESIKLSPSLRQMFLAKAASLGLLDVKNYEQSLKEYHDRGQRDLFERLITESLKKHLETRLMSEATKMFNDNLGHNKAMREFLLTPEGSKLMDAGRKVAFEYAHEQLQQLFPGEEIPPFPNDKITWFK